MRFWAERGARLLLGGLLLGTGCEAPPTGPTEPLSVEACGSLTWDAYGQGEMRSWCTGCHSSALEGEDRHGAPPGVDFDSHDGVVAHLDGIIELATGDEPSMPPVGGGDAEDRERLLRWLQCGAP